MSLKLVISRYTLRLMKLKNVQLLITVTEKLIKCRLKGLLEALKRKIIQANR